MSKRVTTLTEVKDRAIAEKALRDSAMGFRSDGATIYITSGALAGATIDLTTGVVSGDDMTHSAASMGKLRQLYSEAKMRLMIANQGGSIQSTKTLSNGDIELLYQVG